MTTDQFIKKQEAKIALIMKENKPLMIAVRNIMTIQSKRIFLDAKGSNDAPIGIYKGGELYVSVKKNSDLGLKNFTPKGKPGAPKKADRKTGYFFNYLSYKKTIGRNKRTLNVDLFLSGDLHRDWANAEIGKQPLATKINANEYHVELKEENWNKVSKNYPDTFRLSKKEREQYLKTLQIQFTKAMQ